MDFDMMVDYIVQEVLKKIELNETAYKVERNRGLVIINGGTGNLEQIILELKKISEKYELDIVFSEAGEKIVSKEKFQNFNVIDKFEMETCEPLLKKNDIIILPLLTKNSCAKIAVGIRDNAVTYLISKALLAQKEIVAVYDSCIADNKTAYGNQINFNIEKLKSYGIIFVKSSELSDYILNRRNLEINSLKEKKIITAEDIYDMKNKKIIVSKSTIVTTLAREKAENNGIIFETEK
ncbi:flavoprotein [Fusobacterium ulcerans]|uniref:flavoprotein n=1 Tax=Fusobacterium ulcerans TaxID=861 RepID=UPI0030AAC663